MLFRGGRFAPFFSKKELEMKEIKKPETVYLKKDYVDERTGIKKLSNIIKCENCRVYQIDQSKCKRLQYCKFEKLFKSLNPELSKDQRYRIIKIMMSGYYNPR